MNIHFLVIMLIHFTAFCSAQVEEIKHGAFDELSTTYQLTSDQDSKLHKILDQKIKNLKSLEDEEGLDELQLAKKRSSIEQGFMSSLYLILDEGQRLTFNKIRYAERNDKIKEIERLKQEGYSAKEINKIINR